MRRRVKIVLRRLQPSDATLRYLSWLNQPEIRKWITVRPSSLRSLETYIREQTSRDNVMFWGIFTGRDGQHIGNIKVERRGLTATLGLLIGEGRGRDYGPAAIRLATRWCFRWWDVNQMRAGIHPSNRASLRAFEKAGFIIQWPERVWAIRRR